MKKFYVFLFAAFIITGSCKKVCCEHPLFYLFTITHNDGSPYFNQIESLKMYTYHGNSKQYFNYFETTETILANNSKMYTWYIPYGTGETFKQTYYLELPGGDVDTLFLYIRSGSKGSLEFDQKFNGKPIEVDTQSIPNVFVHLLKK
jgi:hypothetical protein